MTSWNTIIFIWAVSSMTWYVLAELFCAPETYSFVHKHDCRTPTDDLVADANFNQGMPVDDVI
jgi:hypothetical protein